MVYIFLIYLLGGVYEKYTTCTQNRDQRIYIYIYIYIHRLEPRDKDSSHIGYNSLRNAQVPIVAQS